MSERGEDHDYRVETQCPTGHITSGEPMLTRETAQALADESNRTFGHQGFHSTVKKGPMS